jgi:hypothetical protein
MRQVLQVPLPRGKEGHAATLNLRAYSERGSDVAGHSCHSWYKRGLESLHEPDLAHLNSKVGRPGAFLPCLLAAGASRTRDKAVHRDSLSQLWSVLGKMRLP